MVRHRLAVGQHAEPDPQPLDRRETTRGRQQFRHLGKGSHAGLGQALTHRRLVTPALGEPVPQQRCHTLEASRPGQILDRLPPDDQPSGLAIDFAHHRIGHDHPIETAIHPCLQHRKTPCCCGLNIRSSTYIVNID